MAKPFQPFTPSPNDSEEHTVIPVIHVDSCSQTDTHPERVERGCDAQQEHITDLIPAYRDGLLSFADLARIASGHTV